MSCGRARSAIDDHSTVSRRALLRAECAVNSITLAISYIFIPQQFRLLQRNEHVTHHVGANNFCWTIVEPSNDLTQPIVLNRRGQRPPRH